MATCTLCNKKSHIRSWSRHQKGSSGATEWPLRAQIHKNTQKPNLHKFHGNMYCTKCLRIVKPKWVAPVIHAVAIKAPVVAQA